MENHGVRLWEVFASGAGTALLVLVIEKFSAYWVGLRRTRKMIRSTAERFMEEFNLNTYLGLDNYKMPTATRDAGESLLRELDFHHEDLPKAAKIIAKALQTNLRTGLLRHWGKAPKIIFEETLPADVAEDIRCLHAVRVKTKELIKAL